MLLHWNHIFESKLLGNQREKRNIGILLVIQEEKTQQQKTHRIATFSKQPLCSIVKERVNEKVPSGMFISPYNEEVEDFGNSRKTVYAVVLTFKRMENTRVLWLHTVALTVTRVGTSIRCERGKESLIRRSFPYFSQSFRKPVLLLLQLTIFKWILWVRPWQVSHRHPLSLGVFDSG